MAVTTPSGRLYVSPSPSAPAPAPASNRPDQIATLNVAGIKFEDWESVWIQKGWMQPYHLFRFTAAERDPAFRVPGVPSISKMQFRPGNGCTILLAGQLAITGIIETREANYDANQHIVTLSGHSLTKPASKSSVDTKTGSFDGKNIHQIAQECVAPFGIGIRLVGNVDLTPFKKMQNEKGELIWDFLERLARVRKMFMGCDSKGNFLLIGTNPSAGKGDELIEGYNIKSCNCIITHLYNTANVDVAGHGPASDDHSGTAASEIEGHATTDVPNVPYTKLIIPLEQATMDPNDAQKRADFEKLIRDGMTIQCTIVVNGWLRPGTGALWEEGQPVHIYSPMAMLNRSLYIQTVTFTQDNRSGSLTTLYLTEILSGSNIDPGEGTSPTTTSGEK
jgi:prophage tail gpP-like protein